MTEVSWPLKFGAYLRVTLSSLGPQDSSAGRVLQDRFGRPGKQSTVDEGLRLYV